MSLFLIEMLQFLVKMLFCHVVKFWLRFWFRSRYFVCSHPAALSVLAVAPES